MTGKPVQSLTLTRTPSQVLTRALILSSSGLPIASYCNYLEGDTYPALSVYDG